MSKTVVKKEAEELEKPSLTPTQEKAVELLLVGLPKTQIAAQLRVNRRTILRWTKDPVFIAEYNLRHNDHVATTRQRRLRESNMFADRVSKLASNALKDVEAKPNDPIAHNTAQSWFGEFRAWRDQERQDFGDNVRHHHVSGAVAVGVVGRVEHVHASTQIDFSEYLVQAIDDGIIDVDSIDMDHPEQMVREYDRTVT